MKSNLLPPGKDSTFEDTITKLDHLLSILGFNPKPVSWLNPAPNCWSVHLRFKEYSFLTTNGKGTSKPAALASAMGEFWERLSTNFFFSDYFLGDGGNSFSFLHHPEEKWFKQNKRNKLKLKSEDGTELLNDTLLHFYNSDGDLEFHHLCDNNSDSTKNQGICALPFRNIKNGKKVYFPVSILNNIYVSNGMAAGNSEAECWAQALSEIVERHVKNIVISKGLSLPDVPQSTLNKYPDITAILAPLNEQFIIRVKDASLGGKYPVICLVLLNKNNGGVFTAFGASYRFKIAVERTLTELLQGRNLNQFGGFNLPVHDLHRVADPFNLESHFINSDGLVSWDMFRDKTDFEYTPWDFTGSTEKEYIALQTLITGNGYDIYRADYSYEGMYSCRILVPGMSEIYPINDLVWNNRITGADLRPYLLCLPKMNEQKLIQFLHIIEESNLSDFLKISDATGVLFDKDSCWFTLTIGELKTLIYLALKKDEDAFTWCNWCLDFSTLSTKRNRLFRILHTMLGLKLGDHGINEFQNNLLLFYSKEERVQAESIVAGTDTFPGLNFGKTWSDISKEHAKLLLVYRNFISARHCTTT